MQVSPLSVFFLAILAPAYCDDVTPTQYGCTNIHQNITAEGKAELEFFGSGNLVAILQWTLHYHNGSTAELSTCSSENNCTPSPFPYVTVIRRQPQGNTYSRAEVASDIGALPWSRIVCSEVLGKEVVRSRSYSVRFVNIKMQRVDRNGIINARVNLPLDISCLLTANLSNTVYWTLSSKTGPQLELGRCVNESNCTKGSPNAIFKIVALERVPVATWITLIPKEGGGVGVGVDEARRISCSLSDDGGTDEAVLNVFDQPQLSQCNFDIVRETWTAKLTCNISRIFSSANEYNMYVKELLQPLVSIDQRFAENANDWSSSSETYLLHGPTSFKDNLTRVEVSQTEVYYAGLVSYSWYLSSAASEKWTVKVLICSGTSSETCATFPISSSGFYQPSKPKHNCTGIAYYPESGGPVCTCTVECAGFPAGRLLWLQGQKGLNAGIHGQTDLALPTGPVGRESLVCRLDWIRTEDVVLPVAYGPDTVELVLSYRYDLQNKKLSIVLDCHVTGMNPVTPDMVQWDGPCQGQTGFKCMLGSSSDFGKNVTCRVTNRANNGRSRSAVSTVTQPFAGWNSTAQSQREAEDKCDVFQWSVVGLSIGGAVLLVILLLLVVCLCWHKEAVRQNARNSSRRDDHHTVPDTLDTDWSSVRTGDPDSRPVYPSAKHRNMYLPSHDMWSLAAPTLQEEVLHSPDPFHRHQHL